MDDSNKPNTPEPEPTPPATPEPQTNIDTEEEPLIGTGESKRGEGIKDFASFIGILGIAGILAFLLITFVFRSYAVDGPSMETTLQNQDKLIIWKVPVTWAKLTGNQYVPNRGDIVILTEDNLSACGQEGERQIIKRTIGLPGERVVVKNGEMTVYNKTYPDGFSPDKTLDYNKDNHIPVTTGNIDVTLKENQVFVSGDNRPDSCDSRAFGPVETDQLIGKLVLRLLPANHIKLF